MAQKNNNRADQSGRVPSACSADHAPHHIIDRELANDAVLRSAERYRDLIENASDLIYTHDLEGNVTSLNRAGERLTGYSRQEALSMNIDQVIAPEYLDLARTFTAKKLVASRPRRFEAEIFAKDGTHVILELSTRVIVSSDGLPIGVQGIGRDITDRRKTDRKLHEMLSLFSTTFESTADGIVVMSLDRRIITCNRKFIEMWDVPAEIIDDADGDALLRLIASHLRDPGKFLDGSSETYDEPESIVSELIELNDGRIIERYSQPQYLQGAAIGRVASFRDITERSRAEERLRHYALHDTLTDLPNRVAFMNHLEQAIERTAGNEYAKFAVLFLDLDRFKVINDSLGHAVGDKLLIAVAARLQSCVRPGDVVARLGGDEFTILLNRSGGKEEVCRVAERLQLAIAAPVKIENYEVFTTASIGVVLSSQVARNSEDFLRDADAAMYRAKEAGKARYEVFDRQMHVRNMNLLQIETDLRHAVDRNEFEVLYQPIVEIRTGKVTEFEALIRWRHPVHGLIAPNEFVNVAEETGLMISIGRWILHEACRQTALWQRRHGIKLGISVNLSAKQLMHPTLKSQLKEILADTQLEASQLKIEVTESTVMEHSEKSLNVLSELDDLGISLSTDDFGTGYSSLSYLQKFPFDRLKIDQSFVNLMDEDEKSRAIVKTILMLGENLNLEVVAEGIETLTQLEKLRELGCIRGQGYLFSRPIDRESADQFLAAGANVFDLNSALVYCDTTPLIEVGDVQ
jgi:diguanylate cyclase (GGDEF)-like protein/PAS domain S-box-containing protein